MIEVLFFYASEPFLIRIRGDHVTFCTTQFGGSESTIEGLKMKQADVIKKFPDLSEREDWHEEAIRRFKQHIAILGNEKAISEYIIEDLKQYGYQAKKRQVQGFRPESLQ